MLTIKREKNVAYSHYTISSNSIKMDLTEQKTGGEHEKGTDRDTRKSQGK